MIHFLIDYENVHYSGFEGAEYITSEDSVTIFYSDNCKKIPYYRFKQLSASKCDFEICKIMNTGKNALDFYIATAVGDIYAKDRNAIVAIVSKDKGYTAVRNYWKDRLLTDKQIVLNKNIAMCIQSSVEQSQRKQIIRTNFEHVDLKEYHAKYKEDARIEYELNNLFDKTDYAELIPQIMDIVKNNTEPKSKYLTAVKCFGRKAGVNIYHKIKKFA